MAISRGIGESCVLCAGLSVDVGTSLQNILDNVHMPLLSCLHEWSRCPQFNVSTWGRGEEGEGEGERESGGREGGGRRGEREGIRIAKYYSD